MELTNFRELLAKRADSPELEVLAQFIREDVLIDLVHESLEKMARSRHKGDAANQSLRHLGRRIHPRIESEMIRDAIGHHLSLHKYHHDNGNTDKANTHAKNAWKLVDLAEKLQKHTNGRLKIDAPSPHAWERHTKQNQYTQADLDAYRAAVKEGRIPGEGVTGEQKRSEKAGAKIQDGSYAIGEYRTKTKGWNDRPKDFTHLQQAPHESHHNKEDIKRIKDQPFPWENIKINGKHVTISDIDEEDLGDWEKGHPFDNHPIHGHLAPYGEKPGQRSADDDRRYVDEWNTYRKGDDMNKWIKSQKNWSEENPESYATHVEGKTKSAPIYSKPKAAPAAPAPKADEPFDFEAAMSEAMKGK